MVRTAFYEQSVMVVGGLDAKLCPTLEAPLSVEFSMQER